MGFRDLSLQEDKEEEWVSWISGCDLDSLPPARDLLPQLIGPGMGTWALTLAVPPMCSKSHVSPFPPGESLLSTCEMRIRWYLRWFLA